MDNKKFNDELVDISEDINVEFDIKNKNNINTKNETIKPSNIDESIKPSNVDNNFDKPYSPYNKPNEQLNGHNNLGKKQNSNRQNNNINHSPNNLSNNINDQSDKNLMDSGNKNNNVKNAPKNLKNKIDDTKNKIDNTKQNLNNAKDKIKNAPENIKNKIDNTKNKLNNAKDKLKNAPENVRNNANRAKEKWNNRPRSFSELKDKAKDGLRNSGSKLADKAKQGAKKAGKKAIEKGKKEAKERFENSNVGKAVKNTKKAVDNTKKVVKKTKATISATKKAFKALISFFKATFPWLEIILVILLAIMAILLFASYLIPGLFGDVKEPEEYENYADVDQKTLEKMKEVFNKHYKDNAALGMATVVYPYFSQLFDGNVSSYLSTTDNDEEDDDEDPTIEETEVGLEEDEDVEKEEDDQDEEDMYLIPFRSSKVRKRLNKVLEKLDEGMDSWENYLKDTYFKGDKGFKNDYDEEVLNGYNGYKKLFKAQINTDDEDKLEDAIIKNLNDIKDMFLPYIFDQVDCVSNTTSLGTGNITQDTTGKISSNMVIHVLKDGKEQAVLSMEDYVIGVAKAEIGFQYEESTKAQMIAAQSFIIGLSYPGGTGIGRNLKHEVAADGTIHYYISNGTNTQVWCDPKNCYNGNATDEEIEKVRQWYKEIEPYYIYKEDGGYIYASYRDNCSKYGLKGDCMSQNEATRLASSGVAYDKILFDYSYTDGFVLYDSKVQGLSLVSSICTGVTKGGCAIEANDFTYYSQRQYDQNFCGRSDATISSSGCGVTSMAMIISNLTDTKMDPVSTMNEAATAESTDKYCGEGVVGTNYKFFEYSAKIHGLTYSEVKSTDTDAEQQVKNTLNAGGLIIANVGKGWQRKDQGPVEVGHYLVIRGITGDGKLLLADPMLKEATLDPADSITFDELTQYMKIYNKVFHLFTSDKSDEIKEKYCKSPLVGASGEATGYLKSPLLDINLLNKLKSDGYPLGLCRNSGNYHGAIDVGVGRGTKVYAMDGGIVYKAVNDCVEGDSNCGSTFGNHVIIKHDFGEFGDYYTLYAHLSKGTVQVKIGDQVGQSQYIGDSGNTGRSTGDHLHFELEKGICSGTAGHSSNKVQACYYNKSKMNPLKYIDSNIQYAGQIGDTGCQNYGG